MQHQGRIFFYLKRTIPFLSPLNLEAFSFISKCFCLTLIFNIDTRALGRAFLLIILISTRNLPTMSNRLMPRTARVNQPATEVCQSRTTTRLATTCSFPACYHLWPTSIGAGEWTPEISAKRTRELVMTHQMCEHPINSPGLSACLKMKI